MEKQKYTVFCQYEYWGREGKTWTQWFKPSSSSFYDTENEAKEKIKQLKEGSKNVTKHTKLKYNYEVRLVDIKNK